METKSVKQILRVLVGSQAHGLATPESDYDYRGVFVNPTSEILRLGSKVKDTDWHEDFVDDTSWEIGHFLNLAIHCNPTILEVFLAPIPIKKDEPPVGGHYFADASSEGMELRELFPIIWNSKGVFDSFTGYGFNQRKKFLDNKDNRAAKYAAAYLRTLYQGWELLTTGTFTIRIIDTPIGPRVRDWKDGKYSVGEVIQICTDWQVKVEEAYKNNPDKQTDMEKVNEFLLKIRKDNW